MTIGKPRHVLTRIVLDFYNLRSTCRQSSAVQTSSNFQFLKIMYKESSRDFFHLFDGNRNPNNLC